RRGRSFTRLKIFRMRLSQRQYGSLQWPAPHSCKRHRPVRIGESPLTSKKGENRMPTISVPIIAQSTTTPPVFYGMIGTLQLTLDGNRNYQAGHILFTKPALAQGL